MLITPYAAAKEAGVHKQTIYDQIKKKPYLPYFSKGEDDAVMIDNENPVWRVYVAKKKLNGAFDVYTEMGQIMVLVLQEKLDIEKNLLGEILDEIDRRYSARVSS